MARITKPPHVRRDELLDGALALCADVGYENLSIDQLTRDIGVAKGTFYYHFPTKQDMLVALVTRFVDDLFADLELTAARLQGSGRDQFRQLLLEAASWKTDRLDNSLAFVPLLYKAENLELRHRLIESWSVRTSELFRPLVVLGAEDGSLRLPDDADADVVTSLVMTLWLQGSAGFFTRALASGSAAAFSQIVGNGVAALAASVERILGAEPGSFVVPFDPAILTHLYDPFVAALNGHPTTETRSSR